MNNWHNFQNWKDIRNWCEEKGFNNLVKRMDINHTCWNSCGEFGRSQVAICDNIRFAKTEDEAIEIASEMDAELASDIVLQCATPNTNDPNDALAFI